MSMFGYDPRNINTDLNSSLGALGLDDELLSYLLEGGMDTEKIAGLSGLKKADEYGKYFTPPNLQEIKNMFSELQDYKEMQYQFAGQDYNQGLLKFATQAGQTGLVGSGSIDRGRQQINQQFGTKLAGIDQNIAGMEGNIRGAAVNQFQGVLDTANRLYSEGAKFYAKDKNNPYLSGYQGDMSNQNNSFRSHSGTFYQSGNRYFIGSSGAHGGGSREISEQEWLAAQDMWGG